MSRYVIVRRRRRTACAVRSRAKIGQYDCVASEPSDGGPTGGLLAVGVPDFSAWRGRMEQTVFTDSDGVQWVVREDGADEARSVAAVVLPGTAWLRFESELEVRR